jgi:radical SAM superfamily enzyme YgiQ (UPF0313 family)
MQIHGEAINDAIRDAWSLGEDRPLILAGGPKAIYEPSHLFDIDSPKGRVAADVACTGEAYVLLELLEVLLACRRHGEPLRWAFERARLMGALDSVPGLVYLAPEADLRRPTLVDTGLQRLVQHIDEMPDEQTGYTVLEPPGRRAGLAAAPLPEGKVRKYAPISSLLVTQGCKFNCSYCPIPAVNQKTWRFRSPENLARQLSTVRDRFGIKYYFGTDDNFFNRRQTAWEFFEALARWRTGKGKRLGHQVRLSTEATQHDTWKNRDLLPLARQAGLFALWFGIEDLTAELVNKGQKPEVTIELFKVMHREKILPMAMMMFHEGQPFHSPGQLYGIANQVDFLRQAGAITVQVTVHTPAVGTREYERPFREQRVLQRLGRTEIPFSRYYGGNHVLVKGQTPLWKKQLQWLGAYFRFYNPVNAWRAGRDDGSPLRWYRFGYQLAGFAAAVRTAWKMLPHLARLLWSRPIFHADAPPASTMPVRLAPGAFPRVTGGVVVSPPVEECQRAAA